MSTARTVEVARAEVSDFSLNGPGLPGLMTFERLSMPQPLGRDSFQSTGKVLGSGDR